MSDPEIHEAYFIPPATSCRPIYMQTIYKHNYTYTERQQFSAVSVSLKSGLLMFF